MKYMFLAPFLIPKLKKGIKCDKLNTFEFLFNRNTKEQFIKADTDKGISEINGVINIQDFLNNKYGKMTISELEKISPDWVSIYGIINAKEKYICLNLLDGYNKITAQLKYN